ncbi:ROK family protein [Synechococcales cyanobacterium C]|uniref:ROK family protein n=1 Tax=Petrachloros mirabilis ULC683 TaxID=2781853 RepID=A0A8K1ZYY8_9CYAN|nr:ROK family protein [Petrachloros mirabilis ULC683]
MIGIDLGGTAIKLGCFDVLGQCLASLEVATPQPATPEAVMSTLVEAISKLDPEEVAIALGIGTPGPADAAGRIARIAINLPDWQEVPLADRLEALTGKPTAIGNDANCAALGEAWLGAGRPYQNWILLTLGTGVGGAIFLNRKLFVGQSGAAGELGLITLRPKGPPCNSGNAGSLEQYASARSIQRRTGLTAAALAAKARGGDQAAIAFWQQYGQDLGAGLASLIYVLTPEAIVLGGGVSASADLFLPTAQNELEQRVMATSRESLVLVPASLGNRAGMLGAARLAWERMGFQLT